MKRFNIIISLLIASLFTIKAQDPISEAVKTIVSNNLDIKSQLQLIEAQIGENKDANMMSNPEVALGRVWGRHGIGNKLQLDVTQSFDWPGLYRARRQAANEAVNAAEIMVVNSSLDIAMSAKETLLQLVYVRKCLALTRMLRDNAIELEKKHELAYDRGEITILDRRKLQIEIYELDSQIAGFVSQENDLEAQLEAMCPNVPLSLDDITEYPVEAMLSADEYQAQVMTMDPELLAAQGESRALALEAKAANLSRFPGFSVGYQHQAEMGDRFNGFTVSMSLPFFENRHAKNVAISKQAASEYSQQMILAQRYADIEKYIGDMQCWRTQIEHYQKVFGDNAYLPILKKAYDGGELTVLDYINEVHYFHQVTFSYLESEYNYAKSLAQLNKYSLIQ